MKIPHTLKMTAALGVALLFLLFAAPPVTPVLAANDFPRANAYIQAVPSVVWCADPASTTRLEVHIVGRNDVAQVWLTQLGTSASEGRAELFDDGTHGDQVAGDNVFTLGGVVLPCNPTWLASHGGITNWWGAVRVKLDNGSQLGNDYGMRVGQVHTSYKGVFPVHNFGGGLTATPYAFFILDAAHQVMSDYPVNDLGCGTTNFVAYQKLYSVMPDVFDFAIVTPGMQIYRSDNLGENVPYNVVVSNAVQHIGMAIFNNTATFGSAGRLKAAIYQSFSSLDVFDHEIGHTWTAYLGQTLGLLDLPISGHWNDFADMQGQMGAYFFTPGGVVGHFAWNGDGTWHLVRNNEVEPYSPLELYAMGMIPPAEVPPIHILQGPNIADLEHITAASYQTITINQVMTAEGGARVPSSAASQKDFSVAFIVTQDLPYNDAAYAYFSLEAVSLEDRNAPDGCCSAPFYWATGGRGTLMVRMSTFADVTLQYWAYDWIGRLYQSGITTGCSSGPLSYCPEEGVNRAQMAIFLERGIHGAAYHPPAVGGSTGFADVPTSHWAAAWIKQLAADGVTTGCGSGNFCPNGLVSRDQMAVFLLRARHGAAYTPPPVGASTGFADVPVSHWAAAWIKQLALEGITTGCGGGNYCPNGSVSRAQMAVFLVRTFNLP